MSRPHQIGKKLQEKRQQQQTDMHSVHIGIRSDNHIVIAQIFQPVLDIQSRLQKIEFLVLIHHLFRQSIRI